MSTFLFDDMVFGPVSSRRLGVSLGINLLPTTQKLCNFNCLYCECGLNEAAIPGFKRKLPTSHELKTALESKLQEMSESNAPLDSITFAGNGEPTLHPEFVQIVDDSIALRDIYFPDALISVLSNATLVFKEHIRNALERVDRNILKIDSAFEDTIQIINCPNGEYHLDEIVENMAKFISPPIIQTMFVKGSYNGKTFDNTTPTEVQAWLDLLQKIQPAEVMIYSIARDTPIDSIEQINLATLEAIGHRVEELGIRVKVTN